MSFSINVKKCNGCDECMIHCTTGAINSVLDERKKYCKIDSDICVSCGHCAHFCKEGAIRDDKGRIVRPVPEEERSVPDINFDVCNGCMLCVESCPEYALTMIKITRTYSVAALTDPDKCLGCGHCFKSCPVRAIDMIKRKNLKNVTG